MKSRSHAKLLISAIISMWLVSGCADQSIKTGFGSDSSASPFSVSAAISNAESAIKAAKANNWIWPETEELLKEAQAAEAKGDNDTAVKLANQAKFEAEAAVKEYNSREKPAK